MLEDVPAVVVDPGTTWTRCGLSSDLTPRYTVPSAYAKDGDDLPRVFGDGVYSYTPSREIFTPVMDGVVYDWDSAAALWSHLGERMGCNLNEQPLSVVEKAWAPAESRAPALEAVFEGLGVPLFTLAKAPLCAAVESFRTTALIVTIGSGRTSVVPVLDGVVATKAMLHSRFAGDFLDAHILASFQASQIDAAPRYQIKQRAIGLDVGEPSPHAKGPQGTPSFHQYQQARIVQQFKQVTAEVSPFPLNNPGNGAVDAAGRPINIPNQSSSIRPFEFPSGYHRLFGPERMAMVEPLFKPGATAQSGLQVPENSLGLTELIYQSIGKVEAPTEVIMNLVSNIVLTGGTTQLQGLPRRVENDLIAMKPNSPFRFHLARGNVTWAGARVMASFGHFDNSWITKAEYEEIGAEQLAEKRFK